MKRILCYGDSNTWGHNPNAAMDGNFRYPDAVRWTGILQAELGTDVRIIEEGLCGRTIMYDDPVSPYRNGSSFLGCCLQSHAPLDMVIFMLGTNDVRHIFTPSVKEIAMGMDNLVRQVKIESLAFPVGEPEILVIAPAPVREEIAQSDFYGMYDEESVQKSRLLAQEYQKIFSGRKGITLLDAGKIAEVSIKDCIHLTQDGHRRLGLAAAELVRKVLGI